MLPDFGWTELLVIAIVLIVVVGPKDLPRILRGFANTLKSVRKMSGDFRRQFDEALKEAELGEVSDLVKEARSLDPRKKITEALNPLGDIGRDLNNDLKKAVGDIEAPAKPKSAVEAAMDDAGSKMREAQKAAAAKNAEKGIDRFLKPGATAATGVAATNGLAAQESPEPEKTARNAPAKKAPVKKAPARASASKASVSKASVSKPAASKTTTTKTAASKKPTTTRAKTKPASQSLAATAAKKKTAVRSAGTKKATPKSGEAKS